MLDIANSQILTDWQHHYGELFGQHPMCMKHNLHKSSLFSDEALIALLENVKREDYHVNYMDGDRRREGELGDASGREILDAVLSGNIWINLRAPEKSDQRYGDLLQEIFTDFEQKMPGLKTYKRNMTILISSPKVRVKYHIDVPGQSLWQVRGRKKVFVYPAQTPFLPPEAIEKLVINEAHETDMKFENWFDDHALIKDLEPGEMLHWPLNGPHRVENHDCLNVSITTEHWTDSLRNIYAVNYANGMLRKWGMKNLNRSPRGAVFLMKLGLAGTVKLSGMQKKGAKPYRVDFKVESGAPDGITDIPAYEFSK